MSPVARIALCLILILPSFAQAGAEARVEDFSDTMANWWIEGGERVWLEGGRLHMKADNPKSKSGGAATAWWKSALPADFVLTLQARVISSPTEVNNINLFLCYSDPSGRPLFETRESRSSAGYNLYHGMNGYIVTFVNDAAAEGGRNADGSTKARIRIRKNPGFRLLKETFTKQCRAGATYELSVTKQDRTIRFAVDGETLLEAQDERPWADGLMALRTFGTYLWWDNIRVVALPR